MPFPIDVSRPFRYPSELRRLAEAVHYAGDYDETRWVEWKSTLDLTAVEGIRHAAKQILGFANREPKVAAAWAQGHAYLVIGVSPKILKGVTPVDPERLVSSIQPYVGGEIAWTPEYIQVDHTDILVIIVEPPRPGDAIHLLRKDLDKYRAGTVFIRRPGQTVQADVDEMRALQRRLLAGTAQIELVIEPVHPMIEARPDFQALTDNWIARERARRLSAHHKPEATEDGSASSSSIVRFVGKESRTLEQYSVEIDSYLDKAREALMARSVWRLARHEPAMLTLQMANHTGRNFTQVQVVLTIDKRSARGFDEDLLKLSDGNEPDLPTPPLPLGTPTMAFQGSIAYHSHIGIHELASQLNAVGRGWQASNTADAVRIEFDPRDIRPHGRAILPAVPLIVFAEPGTAISMKWEATATNADGMVTGSAAINVSAATLSSLDNERDA